MTIFVSHSVDETEQLGQKIGELAFPGMVLAFKGGLGAGKTTMCHGIARGLDIKENITSPTYTLLNEYDGRIPMYHFDVYRLSCSEEFEMLDSVRYIYGNGLSIIEWSEKVESMLPEDSLVIEIEAQQDGSRIIKMSGNEIVGQIL